eukprot:323202-Pleurochrysis_carterae.AAC.1
MPRKIELMLCRGVGIDSGARLRVFAGLIPPAIKVATLSLLFRIVHSLRANVKTLHLDKKYFTKDQCCNLKIWYERMRSAAALTSSSLMRFFCLRPSSSVRNSK